ncbi:MAG: YjfB family protein [Gammaproteobacteria bacterium]|nr:YjfB family protein [Gammaproteobacteria bacterium]MBD3777397.1 YjfB family protein [Thiotrichales bacterium]
MEISANGAVAAALAQQQVYAQGEVQVSMLKKAIDTQSQGALQLIASLPTPPPAPVGALGQNINIKV